LPATLHFQFATYGNQSQTTWRGDAFLIEAFIFYFCGAAANFYFYFSQSRIPSLSAGVGGASGRYRHFLLGS
jgi:hypothetical protein